MRTVGFGESRASSTSGVEPIRSRSEPACALVSTGHRRQEDDRLAVVHGRLEAFERPDVLAAEIDVDERCELAVREKLRRERRIAVDEVVDDLAHRVPARLELALTADLGAQRGRDANGRHQIWRGALQNST